MHDPQQLFDFMLGRVNEVSRASGLKAPQAFGKWFAETYFPNPQTFLCSDGSGDGKVDSFFQTSNGSEIQHCVLNTKFTQKFGVLAPVSFYDEITRFWQAFANKGNRKAYLANAVRSELRSRYEKLFDHYDDGRAQLFFVTNHRRNPNQYASVKDLGVQVFHLEEMLQFVLDYIEDAMPHTPELCLTGINTILSADRRDTTVPTSIVFAKLIDMIRYMKDEDPFDLLFARNIRLKLQNSKVNVDIANTLKSDPAEFVFSNNGITMLCEAHSHDPGKQELRIKNPRVVNGSQTLHSVRVVANPSNTARVMVRIIEVAPFGPTDVSKEATRRRDVVEKISIRSNLQNPIKKWNLISNDVFQHDLARFFRKKKLYYERRDGEWAQRRTELKSVGIHRGPHIKGLTQLIASYHWETKVLGPTVARRGLAALFEDKPYKIVRSTSPEVAYELYLLGEIMDQCLKQLSRSKKYMGELASYTRLALFALIVKGLQGEGVNFENAATMGLLASGATSHWRGLCDRGAKFVRATYQREAKQYRKRTGSFLSLANFSKTHEYVWKLFAGPLPQQFRQAAKMVVRRS